MSKELEMIEMLRFSPIVDRDKDKEQAKKIIKKYFAANWSEKWELLTHTYKSNLKISKEEWIKEARGNPVSKFKIRKVLIKSGCLAVVSGDLKYGEIIRRIHIGLTREYGPYNPGPSANYLIVGTTVPPYIAV